MNENLKDQDVLLVKEKGSNELRIANMGKDGKMKTAKPDGDNPDFLKIDKHGNILENFFANFMRQVKEPTRFEFFRVPADKIGEVMQKLQEAFKNPDKPENKEFIDVHRVDTDELVRKQT
jgi:preprotein translocase subunit Sss1